MRIIREKERENKTGIPRSSWHVMDKQGLVPKAIPLGDRRKGWLESEIDELIEQLAAQREST
jgi:predicted DNA-binding transcriptional regulator AlpA